MRILKRIINILINCISLITLPIWILPVVIYFSIKDGEFLDHISGKNNMFFVS